VDLVDVGHLELEVDAAAEGRVERRRPEPAAGPGGLLQHERRPGEGQVGEPLLGPLVVDREAEHVDGEAHAALEVGDVELRDQRHAGGQPSQKVA
jgi:hypothetical protein